MSEVKSLCRSCQRSKIHLKGIESFQSLFEEKIGSVMLNYCTSGKHFLRDVFLALEREFHFKETIDFVIEKDELLKEDINESKEIDLYVNYQQKIIRVKMRLTDSDIFTKKYIFLKYSQNPDLLKDVLINRTHMFIDAFTFFDRDKILDYASTFKEDSNYYNNKIDSEIIIKFLNFEV